jgi:hypothetical protein
VRNETSVKSGCFFFLLPFSFFLPDEQVFFSLARKRRKKEEGRRKNAQLNYAQSSFLYGEWFISSSVMTDDARKASP